MTAGNSVNQDKNSKRKNRVKVNNLLTEAGSAIISNKSRTVLTLLGIVIGISSVITVLAAGAGGRSIIMKEFEGLSPTALQIGINWEAYSLNRSYKIDTLSARDIEDLEEYAPHLTAIAPLQQMKTELKAGDREKQLTVTGTTEAYIEYVDVKLESGRIMTTDEVERQEKVAIIGHLIKEEFFPDSDAVGQYIRAFGVPVKIVGVLEYKEKTDTVSLSNPDETFNNAFVVPISLFKRLFGGDGSYWDVMAKATSIEDIPRARSEILRVLARNHGKWNEQTDKFSVTSMKEQLEMINTVITTITIGVAVLAGIALLVAAIGIMNIMLVSVKERTREIGIRKALGARESDIRLQFLIETLILCGGGGLGGLGLSVLAAFIIGKAASWPVIMDPGTAAAAVILSLVTGLLSGFYPAARAAKLIPHEALRYE
ncbi:MAG: ABC transporter permease [Spirochaetales bacterium]|uniref:ABC transporter permease n=1 Tax=Candidatus Thalassospirochaeta sargassi TaxID=3119039 RepID=A0AAJ1ICS7_9SPIO|nr:ABC transporter permease [Spirochaetales bacterium]